MSGGGKSSTSTSTVSIPPEVLQNYQYVNQLAQQTAQQPFTPYTGQFVAPLTATQQSGIANVSQAAGTAQPYYQAAGSSLLGGAAQAQPYYQQAGEALSAGQAAANPLQSTAAGNIAGAQAGAQPYQALASQLGLAGAQQMTPGALNVGAYMSPYIQSVAEPTLQALRQQQQQEQQSMVGNQIRSGAFGGDRGRIAQAVLAQQQNLATSQALGNIYQQGYGQALGAAQQQQQIGLQAQQASQAAQQQAAQLFSGLGSQAFGQGMTTAQQQAALAQQLYGQGAQTAQVQQALGQGLYGIGAGVSQGLAGIGAGAQQAGLQGGQAQLAAGTVEQQTQQAQNQALYNQFLQQQGYPFQVAQFLANIAMGTGALSGSTTTTQQPSSFFSDERLKEDVEPIGKTFDGQNIVRFKYKGEPGTRIGLVAQDVEKRHPEAVGLAGGYKTVDYDAATDEAAARAPKAYGGGLSPWEGGSMGGSVFREDAGAGFAAGGAPGDDILAQINALVNSHQGMYPYGKAGLYGGGMGKAGPYGSTLMQTSPRLMTAQPVRQEPPYDVRQAMRDVQDISKMPENIQKGYSGIKTALIGTPESSTQVTSGGQTRTEVTPASSGLIGRGGEFSLRESGPARTYREIESFIEGLGAPGGNARGGAIRSGLAAGGLPYSEATDEYVPEDISKPMQPPKLQTPSTGPMKDQGMEDAKTAMQIASTIAAISASDRRLKDNIEPIGKLFDGQKVYRYNLKGDDEKRIGLMAQEVEKRYPDAVGLMPRRGYRDGGDPESGADTVAGFRQSAIDDLFNRGLIPLESRGRQFNERGEPLRSSAGAVGIAQVMPSTGPEAARLAGMPWDPQRFERDQDYNQALGRAYYTQQLREFGDPLRAAAAYNAGPERLRQALAGGDDYFSRLPAETQAYLRNFAATNPGGLIPPALSEQVFGRSGQPTAAPEGAGLAPPRQQEARREEPDRFKERLAKNEYWLVPLLTGLGTMASSPSRYLGAAALQGLMGAGQAFQGQLTAEGQRSLTAQQIQTQAAQEARQRMETAQIEAGIVSSAEDPRSNSIRIYGPDGIPTLVSRADYYRNRSRYRLAPYSSAERRQLGIPEPGAAQTPTIPGAAAPTPTAGAPIPRPGEVSREPLPPSEGGQPAARPPATTAQPEEQPAPVYHVIPRDMAENAERIVTSIQNTAPSALNAATVRNIWPDIGRSAAAQSATVNERNAFAAALSSIPATGPLAAGRFGELVGTPAVQWANSLLRTFGIPGQITPEDLASVEEAKKMTRRLGIEQQAQSGSRAFQELRTILEAVPNVGMEPKAQADLIADTYIGSQRQIDLSNAANLYRGLLREKGLTENQLPFAGEQFENDFARRQNPIYAEERGIISNMFQTRVNNEPLLKKIIQQGGEVSPEMIDFLSNRYGPRGLEVLRYFRGA